MAALEHHLGSGWEFATRVVFAAPHHEVAPWIRPAMGRLDKHPEGCVLIGSTGNPAMYVGEWLAAVPCAFRVEGGEELRRAVATLSARLRSALADRA